MDTRPYELAIARAYRAPEMADAYRAELAACGWPLSELEEAAMGPVYRAFRVGMAAAEMDDGLVTGNYDLAMIGLAGVSGSCHPSSSPGKRASRSSR